MNIQDAKLLMEAIHPKFFAQENIRNLSENLIYDEMVISLQDYDEKNRYAKEFGDDVTFGYYEGNLDDLKKDVEKVMPEWIEYYNGKHRIYCGYIDGKVASFCLVEDMGVHKINGRTLKIGGPGCVGTIPAYRDRGIGLTMINQVTQIFKNEGYDYSYIHFTGVPGWYRKLGYQTTVQWNKNGIITTSIDHQ